MFYVLCISGSEEDVDYAKVEVFVKKRDAEKYIEQQNTHGKYYTRCELIELNQNYELGREGFIPVD